MSVVCFVEQDADGDVVESSLRTVTFARSLARQSGEDILAVVVASRARAGVAGAGVAAATGAGTAAPVATHAVGVSRDTQETLGAYGVADVCLLVL
ncbi:MAG TPA: hypothetical protein VEH29_10450, partial [Acidimicrobiales bacterium]|nr:hypothetical protein [Acidimicrobiales bacterium]